jgi:hypothetical protein
MVPEYRLSAHFVRTISLKKEKPSPGFPEEGFQTFRRPLVRGRFNSYLMWVVVLFFCLYAAVSCP